MNKVFLIGRLTRDPELRYTQGSNAAVCNFTIAVDRVGVQSTGGNETADFIPVVVWNKPAENCKNYLSKGSQVEVDGSIQVRTYDDQNGQRRYVTEVIASRVEFLGGKGGNSEYSNNNTSEGPTPYDFANTNAAPANKTTDVDSNPFADFGSSIEISDDELPF